jgi:hypothetical protein
VLFRQVFFHEDTQSAAYVNEIICGRLCDPEDQLSCHVHHLGIALKTQDAPYASEKMLLCVINGVKELRDFSSGFCPDMFNMVTHFPLAGMHDSPFRKWYWQPSIPHDPTRGYTFLNVNRDQNEADVTTDIELDMKLLSSPQLHSLDLMVCGNFVVLTPRSELIPSAQKLPAASEELEAIATRCWQRRGPKNMDRFAATPVSQSRWRISSAAGSCLDLRQLQVDRDSLSAMA